MVKITIQSISTFLLAILACVIPSLTMAKPLVICGYALFGIGAEVALCKDVVAVGSSKRLNSCPMDLCTSIVSVGEQSTWLTVEEGETIHICYLVGSTLFNFPYGGSNFVPTMDGMYGVQGNIWAGFGATWQGPQYPCR